MPRPRSSPPAPTQEEVEFANLVAAREEFGAGFTRTVTGNYVRTTEDGVRLVVFQKWGRWHWLMDDGEEPPRYSSGSCEEAESAVGDLFRVWAGVL